MIENSNLKPSTWDVWIKNLVLHYLLKMLLDWNIDDPKEKSIDDVREYS